MAENKTKIPATNENIVNYMRSVLPVSIADRIPEATQSNMNEVFESIWNYKPVRDEFMTGLFEMIGIQTIDGMSFINPLAEFKKSPILFGSTDEEVYINMAKGTAFDSRAGVEKAFAYYDSYIMALYHKVNFNMQYPITVQYNTARPAFMSDYGLRNLIQGKMLSAYSGANYDEYLAMKNLLVSGYENKILPAVQVAGVEDKESAEDLLVALSAQIDLSRFPLPKNNPAGATSTAMPSNLIFFTTPTVKARLGVKALANAYNLSYAEASARTVVVDELDEAGEIQGILCDIRFFRVRDQFREVSYQKNGASLSYDFFLTISEMISPSLFYPVCVFTTKAMDGTTLTPSVIGTVKEGNEVSIDVAINGSGYNPKLFDFEITSTVKEPSDGRPGTTIVPGTNIVIIDQEETNFPITVKVTWRANPSVTANATLNKG